MYQIPLALLLLLGACASKPKPAPEPIPTFREQTSAECRDLGRPTVTEDPRFPVEAIRAGQEGWVVLSFDVEEGKPVHIRVASSSPAGMFDRATIDSMAQQRYSSAKSANACRQTFVFKLERRTSSTGLSTLQSLNAAHLPAAA
jgi:TonB family protein